MKVTHKIVLSVLSFAVLFESCSDELDFVKKFNQPPKVFFFNSETTITFTDSLKTGSGVKPLGKEFYELLVAAKDPESVTSALTFSVESGSAKMFIGNEELTNAFNLENGKAIVNIKPVHGLNTIVFRASDVVTGKSAVATLNLFSYDNLLPVAVVTFKHIKADGPYEMEFDATKSFDQDKADGGQITAYEYVINDDFTNSIMDKRSLIKHHLPGPGGYRIKYRVHDNEGAVSEWQTSEQINIQ